MVFVPLRNRFLFMDNTSRIVFFRVLLVTGTSFFSTFLVGYFFKMHLFLDVLLLLCEPGGWYGFFDSEISILDFEAFGFDSFSDRVGLFEINVSNAFALFCKLVSDDSYTLNFSELLKGLNNFVILHSKWQVSHENGFIAIEFFRVSHIHSDDISHDFAVIFLQSLLATKSVLEADISILNIDIFQQNFFNCFCLLTLLIFRVSWDVPKSEASNLPEFREPLLQIHLLNLNRQIPNKNSIFGSLPQLLHLQILLLLLYIDTLLLLLNKINFLSWLRKKLVQINHEKIL